MQEVNNKGFIAVHNNNIIQLDPVSAFRVVLIKSHPWSLKVDDERRFSRDLITRYLL